MSEFHCMEGLSPPSCTDGRPPAPRFHHLCFWAKVQICHTDNIILHEGDHAWYYSSGCTLCNSTSVKAWNKGW